MDKKQHQDTVSGSTVKQQNQRVTGEYTNILNNSFYKINNFDSLEPFFMSIVSSSDHWLFVSSNGKLPVLVKVI